MNNYRMNGNNNEDFKREDITKVSINPQSNQVLANWQDALKEKHGLVITYNTLANIFIQQVSPEAQEEGINKWMKKVGYGNR
jgi:hypothetical protein